MFAATSQGWAAENVVIAENNDFRVNSLLSLLECGNDLNELADGSVVGIQALTL